MNKTSIEWTDYTSNPLRARNIETGKAGHFCERVSPGCAHCYASEWNEKRYGTGVSFLPANRGRIETYLVEAELQEWQKPKYAGARVFVSDMTDLFGEWVPDEWLDRIFGAMALASAVTFQVLTKRPEQMRAYFADKDLWFKVKIAAANMKDDDPGLLPWPLPNIWLGVSVENQRWADERIPILLDTPAAVRFLSCEPLLGPVDLTGDFARYSEAGLIARDETGYFEPHVWALAKNAISWVIVGGESGPKHRPFDPDWARSTVAQCRKAGVACFVKQLGGARPGNRIFELPPDLRVREFPR